MRTLRNILPAATTSLVMALTVFGSVCAETRAQDTQQGPEARDSVTNAQLAAWACDRGSICFWNRPNGTGSRCMWDVADPDWLNGNIHCSWANIDPVRSVYNNSGPTDKPYTGVVYYRRDNYKDRVGCTRNWERGNLAGTYMVRSHEWTTGHCGEG
jgi:hypothetical protein